MRKTPKSPGDKIVKDFKRAARKHYSSEEKIRIVLIDLRLNFFKRQTASCAFKQLADSGRDRRILS